MNGCMSRSPEVEGGGEAGEDMEAEEEAEEDSRRLEGTEDRPSSLDGEVRDGANKNTGVCIGKGIRKRISVLRKWFLFLTAYKLNALDIHHVRLSHYLEFYWP